jgi:hypothetical protein
MTEATRAIVDYAEQDDAKNMRDAFYSELQNKVMAHIENEKIRVAQTMFNPQPDPMATVTDEPVSAE